MVDLNNFLDLHDVIVNEIFGSYWLFVFVGILLVAYFSARFNMNWQTTIVLEALFLGMVFITYQGIGMFLYVLLVILAPSLFYFALREKFKSS